MKGRMTSLIAIFAVMLGLSACNTMQGMGRDIERAGEEISEAAN